MDDTLRELCRRASTETDSAKLLELVKQISDMLDRQSPEKTASGEAKPSNPDGAT